jgi:hypothetical protein
MTPIAETPDSECIRYERETFKEAVSQASKATSATFARLILVLSVFGIVTYGRFLTEEVSVPLVALKLNRWHAAALGPPLVALAAFNFACARALLQMRIKQLMPYLRTYLQSHSRPDLPTTTPEEFIGAILHPSFHVVLDYLYVRNWRGFRFVIWILMSLWFLIPLSIAHMTYTVLANYHWNIFLAVFYLVVVGVAFYSILVLLKVQEADFYFDFND